MNILKETLGAFPARGPLNNILYWEVGTDKHTKFIAIYTRDIEPKIDINQAKIIAQQISKLSEMYEALKSVIRLKSLIAYGNCTPESELGEARAIGEMLLTIESLIKEIES